MRRSLLCVAASLALLCDARPALAASVYINDAKVENLAQEVVLKGCDVRIDTKGNVYITAKGVKVRPADGSSAAAPAPAEGQVGKRYYLVTFQNKVGATQYKVDLYLNGKWTKQVQSKNAQDIHEVTRFLKPGKNTVHLLASKDYGGGPRVSSSAADYYDVVLGEGQESAGRILLERKLVEFRVTAEDTDNRQANFSVEVR
jgi:hypothetical protein